MTTNKTLNAYGVLTEPATLTLQRVLPGPIDRVWDYLTKSELRRQWLAVGDMSPRVGSAFELTWRNDELTDPPGQRPDGFSDEHRMSSEITEFDPPHKLAFTWGNTGGVEFDLEAQGDKVLLTVIHRRLPDRSTLLNVAPGWHTHLDLLVARVSEQKPQPFWESFVRIKQDYAQRFAE